MLSDALDTHTPRSTRIDLVLLTLLCAFTYLYGITDYGVASWHESIRLVTAIDMQARGDWLVPTIGGSPYLSKPPMLYWTTIAIAEIAGQKVSLLHLRLAIALFGWLSVVLTYLAGRSILSKTPGWSRALSGTAAFWASLFLATGLLHVRFSRTGAIDMAVTPFVIGAIWVGFESGQRKAGWRLSIPLGVAMFVIAGGAALVKGPPTLLAIMTALVGGSLGWLALNARPIASPVLAALPYVGALIAFLLGFGRIENVGDLGGATVAALLTGWVLWALLRLTSVRLVEIIRALWKIQIPAAVLGSVLPILIWSQLVASRIGEQVVQANAVTEINENLELYDPDSTAELFSALGFGAGLGSLYAFIACWFIMSRRIRPTPGIALICAWVGVSLLGFGIFSTGSTRYITPILPGVALMGGIAWAHFRNQMNRQWMTPSTWIAIVALAIGQAWWYGDGRDRFIAHHNPRDFVSELVARDDVDPSRIAAFGFWNGGLRAYAGHDVWSIPRKGFGMDAPGGVWTLEEFADRVREDSAPWVLLISFMDLDEGETPAIPPEIESLGFRLTLIPIRARYEEREGREPVRAYRVTL